MSMDIDSPAPLVLEGALQPMQSPPLCQEFLMDLPPQQLEEASVAEKKKSNYIRAGPENKIGLMLAYAQNNGFINAKFLRCQALHDFLFEKLWDSTTFKNNGVFNTAMLFREIPFLLFLQIIGVFQIEPEAEAFMSSYDQHGVTVDDLTGSLRAVVTGLRTKFRVGLKSIVHILCALGLLEPVTEQGKPSSADFEMKYKMVKRVAFYNYIAKNQPFLRYFEMKSDKDVKIFWAHLQYSCSDRRLSKSAKGSIAEGDNIISKLDPARMKVLAGIDNPR
jgi:hypothetical protein